MISKLFYSTIQRFIVLSLVIFCLSPVLHYSAYAQSDMLSQEQTDYQGTLYPVTTQIWDGTNWLVTNTVISRDSWGNVTESKDINNIHSVTKYEANGTRVAATFVNATNSETNVLNFEDGTRGDWTYWTSGTSSTVAHTGSKGWYLSASSNGHITKSFLAADINTSGKYTFSVWVKTSSPLANVFWCVSYNNGSNNAYPGTKYATGTGDWQYLESTLDLSVYPNIKSIYVCATNGSSSSYVDTWWDDFLFYPAKAQCATQAYDPVTLQVTSKTDANGVTTYYRYDGFGRVTETKNADGAALTLTTQSYSSERNGAFTASDPNYVESAAFANGNWMNNWSFENDKVTTNLIPSGWDGSGQQNDIVNGGYYGGKSVKVYHGGTNSSISQYIGVLKGGKTYTASVWFKSDIGHAVNGQLFFGDADDSPFDNAVSTAVQATNQWQRMSVTITMSHDDGMFVYLYGYRDGGASGDYIIYDGVVVEESPQASQPQISRTYTDGLGRTLQTHVWDGANDIITAVQYDDAGRQYRSWRPYSNTGHIYDSNFPTTALAAYASVTSTPYSETHYNQDPLSRMSESVPSGATSTDETIGNSYGSTTIDEAQYSYEQTRMKPGTQNNWMISKKYTDKLGRVVRTESRAEDGMGKVIASTSLYKMTGQPYVTIDPNGFVTVMDYDFLGRLTYKNTVDAGTSNYIYDKSGRLRFMVDAAGLTATPYNNILYWKYDVLGRVIEKGYISTMNWGDASLQTNKDDQSFPATPAKWRKKYTYDAPGCKGSLWKVETNNNDDNVTEVLETFNYDKYGKVTQKDIVVSDYNTSTYSTIYAYDYLGRVTKVTYPGSSQIVTYTYNHLGQTTKVGTPSDDDYFASYTYNNDGSINQETINTSVPSYTKTTTYTYGHRRGWLTGTSNPLFSEAMTYDLGGYAAAGYYSGSIASTSFTIPGTSNYSALFQYDNFGRMTTADNNLDANFDLGLGTTPIVYDNNGNFKSVQEGSIARTYAYLSGTNKASSAGGGSSYGYDVNGNITSVSQPVEPTAPVKSLSSIVYDPFTLMTMSVTTSSKTMKYEYDGKKERVLKIDQSTGSKMLYLHGMNDYPLMTKTTSLDRIYVYGPKGLIAMQSSGTWYYAIKDHLGSTRVVMNGSTGIGVEYRDYAALGALMRSVQNPNLSYRYTGQEFDDETGLHNFRARMYDNYLGRFYAMDPAGQGSSPYAYCGSNPVLYVDKDGRFFAAILALVEALGPILAGEQVAASACMYAGGVIDAQQFATSLGSAALSMAVSAGVGSILGDAETTIGSSFNGALSSFAGNIASNVASNNSTFDGSLLAAGIGAGMGALKTAAGDEILRKGGIDPLKPVKKDMASLDKIRKLKQSDWEEAGSPGYHIAIKNDIESSGYTIKNGKVLNKDGFEVAGYCKPEPSGVLVDGVGRFKSDMYFLDPAFRSGRSLYIAFTHELQHSLQFFDGRFYSWRNLSEKAIRFNMEEDAHSISYSVANAYGWNDLEKSEHVMYLWYYSQPR